MFHPPMLIEHPGRPSLNLEFRLRSLPYSVNTAIPWSRTNPLSFPPGSSPHCKGYPSLTSICHHSSTNHSPLATHHSGLRVHPVAALPLWKQTQWGMGAPYNPWKQLWVCWDRNSRVLCTLSVVWWVRWENKLWVAFPWSCKLRAS